MNKDTKSTIEGKDEAKETFEKKPSERSIQETVTFKVARRRRNLMFDALTLIFASIFVVCLFEILFYYGSGYLYKRSMSGISEAIGGGIAGDFEASRANGDMMVFPDEEPHTLVGYVSRYEEALSDTWKEKYRYLSEFNPDCIGYLEIPGTMVSYPVMFTPERYDYYLWKNFSGQYEQRGLPFMDSETKIGKSQNYLLYGHAMMDGHNFGTLSRYLDKAFWEQYQYCYFNTAYSEGVYQIMYVCRSKIYRVDEDCFKYYRYGGVLSENEFNTYVREMHRLALYETGVTATWGDELLSLSTCDHYTEDGRLIVVCKRIK